MLTFSLNGKPDPEPQLAMRCNTGTVPYRIRNAMRCNTGTVPYRIRNANPKYRTSSSFPVYRT